MKIFVTGAEGFIGKHLCAKLENLGHVVYEADRDEIPVHGLWNSVIHLAGKTTLSKEFNADLIESNIVYSHNLFESFKGRIVYASSTSAAENTSPYAQSKMYLEHLGTKHGNAVGLRFFNVYGNGCNRGIIKAAIDAAKSANTLPLYGGENIRDFIYIDDVVDQIVSAIDDEPGIYDVGTGVGTKVVDAVHKVAETLNAIIYTRTFPGVDTDMKISIASPGITGCISLEEGLKKMLCES